jgi:hypothetical protein
MPPAQKMTRRPSEFRRVIWVFPAVVVCSLIVVPSALFSSVWWQAQSATGVARVAVAGLLGIILSLPFGREIWRAIPQHPPIWKIVVGVIITLGLLGAAIVLREAGIWRWTIAEGDAFVSALCLSIAAAAAITERRKKLRVYLTARHYEFVPVYADA